MFAVAVALLVCAQLSAAAGHAVLPVGRTHLAIDRKALVLDAAHPLSFDVVGAQATDELVIDVVRLQKNTGIGTTTVEVDDGQTVHTLLARAAAARKTGAEFAAWPVRHHLDVRLGDSHVVVRSQVRVAVVVSVVTRPLGGELALVPLSSSSAPVTPAAVPPAAVPPAAVPPADVPPADVPPAAVPPADVPPAAASPMVPDAPVPAVAPDPAAPDPTVVTPAAGVSSSTLARRDAAPASAWPSLRADVHATVMAPLSGIQRVVPGAGGFVAVGPRSGLLAHSALGFIVEVGTSTALAPGARWDANTTSVLFVAHQQWLWDLDITSITLGVGAGVGVRGGFHNVRVGRNAHSLMVVGGAVRLMPEVGVRVGPGSIVLGVPLAAVLDAPGPVEAFEPLAAGVALGYRLRL